MSIQCHVHQDFKWLPLKETCNLSGFKDNEAFEKSLRKIESLRNIKS